jgi:ribonuclease HI
MKTSKALLLVGVLVAGTAMWAASQERYLHVRVSNPTTHELVRVNLPLSLAEKVIPAIHNEQLKNGKVQIGEFKANDVDVRAILEALKTAPEGEFVTVQQTDNDVRVAKEHGQLVVHVTDKHDKEKVDVTIPWEVAQALISETTDNQLNISAAIKALENIGDATLVTVVSNEESVRIWIDSSNTTEK